MVIAAKPFQAFLDEHRGQVLAFLRATVGPDDAEDVFQETFLAALRAYGRMDGKNPRAWVLTIARRKAIDHHRSRSRRPEPRAEVPEPATANGRPDDPESTASGVREAMTALSEAQRAAIALRFAADLPYAEVAAALGCSEDAARRRVHDALGKLRKTFDTEEER